MIENTERLKELEQMADDELNIFAHEILNWILRFKELDEKRKNENRGSIPDRTQETD
jgi:hypothetical protein